MKLLRGLTWQTGNGREVASHDLTKANERFVSGSVATIGAFDGLHLGHQAVLSHLVEVARDKGVPSVVMTMEPLPREYFSPDSAPPRLMRFREKFEVMSTLGVDYLLLLRFNEYLRNTGANQFARDVIVGTLACKHMIVGDDFRFGRDGVGDVHSLRTFGEENGFVVESTDTLASGEERVSSTRIRKLLQDGAFAEAERLLGRPYIISGRVVYGRQLGRTINVPTANIQLGRIKAAMSGVYAVTARIVDAGSPIIGGDSTAGLIPAIANLGTRPTVDDSIEAALEVHLLDYSGDLYGKRLAVRFCKKIRGEKKFDSFDLLKEQIYKDINVARHYFQQCDLCSPVSG